MNKFLPLEAIFGWHYDEEAYVRAGFADEIIDFEHLDDLLNTEFMKKRITYLFDSHVLPFGGFYICYEEGVLILVAKYSYINESGFDESQNIILGCLNEDIPELPRIAYRDRNLHYKDW